MKHTHSKGPWKLNAGRAIETPDGTFTLHKCNDWNPEKIVELDQNARLIAASPDLLEACKLLQAALTEYNLRDAKKRFSLCVADAAASKAIAKAEGEK